MKNSYTFMWIFLILSGCSLSAATFIKFGPVTGFAVFGVITFLAAAGFANEDNT